MKKTENWFDGKNSDEHGQDGPLLVASAESTGRRYPLTEPLASAWDEIGVVKLPALDQNAGNIGRAFLCEARRFGQRQTSANVYPLNGITVITDTLVRKITMSRDGPESAYKATGVELKDGSVVRSAQVIISAGTIRSPQLLMLSGIGPSAHLNAMGINVAVDQPEVGQGLTDHVSFFQHWRLREAEPGLTLGSNNPLFQRPEYGLGLPVDWVVCSDVPKTGLATAIENDERVKPQHTLHPLLKEPRALTETFILYANLPLPGGPTNSGHLTTDIVNFLPTSRGRVSLCSSNADDSPQSKGFSLWK